MTAKRAADAVEAIAVEVFRQCECTGQLVSMLVINRVLNQLEHISSSTSCAMRVRTLRGGGESACRPGVSDGVDLAAVGACDAGTGDALRRP